MYTGCSVLNKSNINNSSTRLADGAIVDGWNARYGISTTTDCLLMGNVGWYGRCGKWKMLTFSNEGGIFPCGFKCCRCWHFSLSRLYWRISLFPSSVLYLKKNPDGSKSWIYVWKQETQFDCHFSEILQISLDSVSVCIFILLRNCFVSPVTFTWYKLYPAILTTLLYF